MDKKILVLVLIGLTFPLANIPVFAISTTTQATTKYSEEDVDWDKIDAKLFENLKKESGKSDAEVYQAMGIGHFEQKNGARAERYLQKAVELDPKLHWSWYHLGLLSIDTEEGYNYFKKATEADQKFSIPYYWMAYYRCRNREDAKAIPLFKKYLEVAEIEKDPQEEGRIKVAKEVLSDLLAGKEGQSLSMMRRHEEE